MSALDSFRKTLLTEITVDEAQQSKIEQELRAYLETAVARLVAKGVSRENAEREVIVAVAGSTWFSRELGVRGGRRWLYLERLGWSVLWVLLVWFVMRDCAEVSAQVLLIVLGWVGLWRRAYNRVEIHGGVVIRRLGRCNVSIPFENVLAVRFETGHLFGRRNVVIEHLGGTFLLSHQLRGMRLALIALYALCPERMDPEVWEYQYRLPVRIRRERPALRWALTVGWGGVLLAVLVGVIGSWDGLGAGLELAVGYVAACVLLFFQSLFHADRRRSAFCTWLVSVGIAAPVLLALGLLQGETVFIRWGLIVLLLMPAMGVSLLVFREQPLRVAVIPVALALLAMGFVCLFHGRLPESRLTLQASPAGSFQWLDETRFWGTGFDLLGTEPDSSCVSWGSVKGDVRTLPLDEDVLMLLPERRGGRLYLLAFGTGTGSKRRQTIYRLLRLDTQQERIEEIVSYPARLGPLIWSPRADEVWSPGGNRFVGLYHHGDSQPSSIAAYDWVREATQVLAQAGWRNYARWEDENTLRLVEVDTIETATKGSPLEEPFEIRVSRVHLEENRIEPVGVWTRDAADAITILSSGRHVLIDNGEIKIETGFVSHLYHTRCVLLDLATAKETALGWRVRTGYAESHSWNPSRGLLAYVASDPKDRRQSLVLFDPEEGVIAERAFARGDQVDYPCLSPDGTRVAYLRSQIVGWGRCGLQNGRLEIWDIQRGKTFVVQNCGLGGTLFGYTFLGPSSLPQWSPRGHFLAYPDINLMEASADWSIEISNVEDLPSL